jgi:hypothetical protein
MIATRFSPSADQLRIAIELAVTFKAIEESGAVRMEAICPESYREAQELFFPVQEYLVGVYSAQLELYASVVRTMRKNQLSLEQVVASLLEIRGLVDTLDESRVVTSVERSIAVQARLFFEGLIEAAPK